MGSGGGYRAACGLSGVFCALEEAGILDCATYVTGLSGSSWYVETDTKINLFMLIALFVQNNSS